MRCSACGASASATGSSSTLAGGRALDYRVVGKETITKQRLPAERLFARDGAPRLVLITCGGPFLPDLGSYRDNLVVVAVPVGQGPRRWRGDQGLRCGSLSGGTPWSAGPRVRG